MIRRYSRGLFQQDRPIAVIGWIEIPQRSNFLPPSCVIDTGGGSSLFGNSAGERPIAEAPWSSATCCFCFAFPLRLGNVGNPTNILLYVGNPTHVFRIDNLARTRRRMWLALAATTLAAAVGFNVLAW